MTQTLPDRTAALPVPPGAELVGDWDIEGYRDVFGADRTVTDHAIRVYTTASQNIDGVLYDVAVQIADGERPGPGPLNSDQARELAAALLAAAAQIDGWVSR